MNVLKIIVLCLSAALVCTSVRLQHPQIAAAVALAAGVAVICFSLGDIQLLSKQIASIEEKLPDASGDRYYLLRICGVALTAEFASDICRDSGESALAKRIDVGTKIAILAASIPLAAELLDGLAGLIS